jgi:hypothetical protein
MKTRVARRILGANWAPVSDSNQQGYNSVAEPAKCSHGHANRRCGMFGDRYPTATRVVTL